MQAVISTPEHMQGMQALQALICIPALEMRQRHAAAAASALLLTQSMPLCSQIFLRPMSARRMRWLSTPVTTLHGELLASLCMARGHIDRGQWMPAFPFCVSLCCKPFFDKSGSHHRQPFSLKTGPGFRVYDEGIEFRCMQTGNRPNWAANMQCL